MSQIISTKSKTLGRGLCIITGASKVLGRALAQQVAPFLQPGSALLLVACSGALLKELNEELQSSSAVHCIAAVLSTKAGVNETVREAKLGAVNDIDHILLINNAGPLDTEMQEQIQRLTGGVTYPLLLCQESAAKLMTLLLDNEFSSGTHLDYFDI